MDELSKAIAETPGVTGYGLFYVAGHGYMGFLYDNRLKEIPATRPWDFGNVEEIMASLTRSCRTLQKKAGR